MDPDVPDLAALRAEYELGGLDESELTSEPVDLFRAWFEAARAAAITEPNAMVLSTAAGGAPSSRTVLLKGIEPEGFVFFTNYRSRKGAELAANPHCSLLFGWYGLQRQVRVEGVAEKISRERTEAYFASRPRGSQLGAWASAQSQPVPDRQALDAAYAAAEERYAGEAVPAPSHWGGYLVRPELVEFWQGRGSRMHDRLVYRRRGQAWATERLMP